MVFRVAAVIGLVVVGAAIAVFQASGGKPAAATPQAEVLVSAGTLRAGDDVPRPRGKALLEVRGVTGGNGGRVTEMDLATIERLPRIRFTTYEPWQKRRMTFEGVKLAELLRVAGVPAGTARVYLHALDDYHVTLPAAELAASDALVATRVSAGAIPLEAGGPLRLVFPDGAPLGRNGDNWIWSIDWVRAEP